MYPGCGSRWQHLLHGGKRYDPLAGVWMASVTLVLWGFAGPGTHQSQPALHEARATLAEIYNWFAEGFGIADLN